MEVFLRWWEKHGMKLAKEVAVAILMVAIKAMGED